MAHHRHRRTRRAPALAIAALLALVVPAATAQAARPEATSAALATERYYSSYDNGATATRPDAKSTAIATERYLNSYGSPEPLAAPTTPAHAADGGPSWTASILGGALLIVAAAGFGVLAGRVSMRPRRSGARTLA
jgi:hypothetical protein